MTLARHDDQEAAEAAVSHLLTESLLMIRYLAASDGDRTAPDNGRQEQVHTLADLCHNLPSWLDPTRRDRIHEGIAFMWRTASPNKQRWVRQCWDAISYDYRWLMSD
ncbi:hypothetical protein [Micromonospora sp. U21]|uniref:hypothetical protein n=1 Tax=Micromonospora sp. U21 TaxID=2824899 RepID=UPI001B359880|nr:hypothetical protein [Micromonospora sp. U21]MBQ0906996.1 hypothetical protein [Micromonospora sp. U21]